jgi:hypothetical protein
LKFIPDQSFLPTCGGGYLPTASSSGGWVPIGMSSMERAYRLLHTEDYVDENPAARRGCSGVELITGMDFKI